ncbi:MAG: hypothetical protein ACI8X3_002130 [Saprospiraceae bacterium]
MSQKYTYGSEKSQTVLDFKYTPTLQTLTETCQQFIKAKQEKAPASILPLI